MPSPTLLSVRFPLLLILWGPSAKCPFGGSVPEPPRTTPPPPAPHIAPTPLSPETWKKLEGAAQVRLVAGRQLRPEGSVLGAHHLVSHLSDVKVDVEALSISLHLPHPHLAGQVAGAGVDALQGEGAVQILLSAIPDVVERDLLWRGTKEASSVPSASPWSSLVVGSRLTW